MGKKTTGRTRHLIVDTLGLLLVVMVTSASAGPPRWPANPDTPGCPVSLDQPGVGRWRIRQHRRQQPAGLGGGDTRGTAGDRQAQRRRHGTPGTAAQMGG